MLKLSRLQDLNIRPNPTPAEQKELANHFEEFNKELIALQTKYSIQLVAQMGVEIPKKTIITK